MFGAPNSHDKQTNQLFRERDQARKMWPFLTPYDLSTLKSPLQLASMIKDRKGISQEEALGEVDRWMTGYNARIQSASLDQWETDGGSGVTKIIYLPNPSGKH
ncbi:hypothetical protein JHC09_16620 [Devosia sp. MC532]|uniref:hypothetical protein n=1 Tax=Devosia sp. MC532 TaxID=2799788 RepID=UPI0018F2C20E|nr:hypothetical protein [Devosia sp. MC532]MBJ7579499.1 hypothetical protein [Devosia sp. MC532]